MRKRKKEGKKDRDKERREIECKPGSEVLELFTTRERKKERRKG